MQTLQLTREECAAIKAMITNQRQKFDELAAEPFASILSKVAKHNHGLAKEGQLFKSRTVLDIIERKLRA